ncbi:MAG: 2-oxoacid:acceptor oxidoreductase family protein [Acidobacteria bacterium]|nr:2-oxoacid:acceptor oxidoreductase family protein [Acidobacteriota bacterium]
MIEIRFHGRGGQGAVVASKLFASAVFREGKYVQAFPAFGVERRGAPVTAFARIDDKPIHLRCQIYHPDHLVVLDPSLIEAIDITQGLKDGGWILINSKHKPSDYPDLMERFKVATVDASGIAVRNHLGSRTNPIVNTAILGAFAKITGLVGLRALTQSVKEEVPFDPEGNVKAVEEAYNRVVLP